MGGAEEAAIPAGDFSAWLAAARSALASGAGTDVDCRDCTGCCSSSYFIHIRPGEAEALARIPKQALVAAPGLPKGHKLMAYGRDGLCPMLAEGKCTIYAHRPQACRSYDCRVFAAAGIAAGGEERARINRRVKGWAFGFPTRRDREEYAAVQAAAVFIRKHAGLFPGGKVPDNPSQLAVLALKVYGVFLAKGGPGEGGNASDTDMAEAVVAASRKFDADQEALGRQDGFRRSPP